MTQYETGEPLKGSDPETTAPASSDDGDEATLSGQVTIPASGAAASVSPLSQSTKEFARVKYLLQCSLSGFLVHDDVAIWDMTNPSLMAQYAQHAHGLLELDSWVAVNDLGAAMGDVHSYGFTSLDASQTGMKFTTGNLQLGVPATNGTRQLVLCKIAVGRSLVIASEDESQTRLPPGYNSFYLRPPHSQELEHEQPAAAGSELTERGYYHEYILNNTGQILPQYLVRFRFSALGSKAAGPCALCEKHTAAVVCRACEAELCSACDQEVHSANKLVSRHKRAPLRLRAANATAASRAARRRSSASLSSAAVAASDLPAEEPPPQHCGPERPGPADPAQDADVAATAAVESQLEEGLADAQAMCRSHDDKRVEFYCSVCELPVCVHCKMVGDHSVGERGSHRLLTIADAYALSLRESLKSDPLVESRKSVIENKLFALAQAKAAVQRNRAAVEAAVRLQCQQALERLEDEVRVKERVLDGESFEFQRQLQQIEWTEDTLEDLRATCPAVAFLGLWNQHRAVRSEQRDFPAFAHASGAEHVKGDLELVGRLHVVSGEQICTVVGDESSEATSRFNSSRTSSNLSPEDQQTPLQPPLRSTSESDVRKRGIEMVEEIRSELLAQSPLLGAKSGGARTSTLTNRAIASSPIARARASLPSTEMSTRATMWTMNFSGSSGLTLQNARGAGPSPMTPQRSRLVSDAWATLLRQELALTTPTKGKQQQQPQM
ncbi:hypothetical protein PybrP1_006369 [[Pythium] brassicae (nom. inval.)]|nr:hypothetical protein PybrP1_006369 [[Pythium] brassicae (nom. inval.)]